MEWEWACLLIALTSWLESAKTVHPRSFTPDRSPIDSSQSVAKNMTTEIGSDIPPEFWQGVEEFNTKEFYACHDTWEAIWMEAIEPDRTFYQGLIQIAVALYHLGNHNWQGCVTLMGEGLRRLGPYQPDYFEISVTPLVQSTQILLRTLQESGPNNVEAIATQIYASTPSSDQVASLTDSERDAQPENGSVEQLPQDPLQLPTITQIMKP